MTGKVYIILCRHGLRAPAKKLFHPIANYLPNESQESKFWIDNCLHPTIAHGRSVESDVLLVDKFPIHSNFQNPIASDELHFPWGSLSVQGASYMKSTGSKLRQILFDNNDLSVPSTITAIATNYRRTQFSARYLLQGLLCSEVSCSELKDVVPITTLDQNVCPMTFYDTKPALVRQLVLKTLLSDEYKDESQKPEIKNAEKVMLEFFPSLGKGKYGFDWPTAFDYFTCRRAHSLPIPPKLEDIENTVLNHFVYRYWSYYQNPEHLTHFITPLLKEIYNIFDSKRNAFLSGAETKSSLTLLSGHDINLFALLHAFGAETVANRTLHHTVWPYYGSTMVLEMDPTKIDSEVKIMYNFEPLLFNLSNVAVNGRIGFPGTPQKMKTSFSLDDLQQLLGRLDHIGKASTSSTEL